MKEKIRILLVVWHPVGGIRTFLRYVYGQFSPDQYQLTILLPDTSELSTTKEDLGATDVCFEVLPQNPSLFSFAIKIIRLLKVQQFDLVHSQGFTSGILAALPAKLSRTPHLLTSHDVLRKDQFKGVKGRVQKLIFSILLSLPEMIHSVSKDAQENLLEFFPLLRKNPQRKCVIPNGIDTKIFRIGKRADLKSKIGLSEKSFLIGYFGRFMPQKGFDILVDAVEIIAKIDSVPDFSVVAFGWGGFIREEQEAIERRGLVQYFSFLPFEPNVSQALRGVDMVAIPSRWEACPLLPMEALVAGVPIIGTDCIGLREVLRGTPGKIVPTDDSQAFADAIVEERENSSIIQVRLFRDKAAKMFDAKNQVLELQKLIQEIVNE